MSLPEPTEAESPAEKPMPKPWSYRIATIQGIPIYLHFTFLLLLIFFAIGSFGGERPDYSAANLIFVLVLFACVVLHELGHSLVARRYGIPVSDITLYPIGGIARIEKQPTPRQELWIALAGPAVNFVIAGLLIVYLAVIGQARTPEIATAVIGRHFWALRVLSVNLILGLFNLIPAFPMDGGRVLRALLAMRMPFDRATAVAANIGQILAMATGFLAIVSNQWMLLFVALFVYMGAGQEVVVARQEVLMKDVAVKEAMLTDLRTLPHGATFRQAAEALLATSQHDFPVVMGDEVIGLLSRDSMLRGMAAEGPDAYVASHMNREFLKARPEDGLSDFLRKMQIQPGPALVFDGEKLAGMVTTENLMEFLMIRQIEAETHPAA
jgi:Zn-dependent protease